jgi:sensor c-di-GMP phosphodiesterase-like protein
VFIDYAEASGMAIPMTLSLMQQVRYDLGELSQRTPGLKISINLFEGHFRDVGIVDDVQAIFGNSPISYDQLVFEITERRPLENSLAVNSVISGLHALGSRIAMDDAGTGHSNLAYIATLGVDVIKIDRIFVDMIKPGTTQVPVLDGLIAMAKDLGCEIVAEGVETEAQAIYLRSRGVVQAQGYIFAPALKVGAFKELALALLSSPASYSDLSDDSEIVTDAA